MTPTINESLIEQAALQWLAELGYEMAFGPEISPGGERPERGSFRDVVLVGRLRAALARLNPHLPEEALEDALRQVLHLDSPNLAENNRRFHRMLRDGVKVEVVGPEGERRGDFARLFDFADPENNDWLAVNQFTVMTGEYNRRADIVVFVNGLPLGVIELKNPTDATATIKGAYQQLQTYMREIPELFYYNEILVVSDSTEARHGTITSSWERFAPRVQTGGVRRAGGGHYGAGGEPLPRLAGGGTAAGRPASFVTRIIVVWLMFTAGHIVAVGAVHPGGEDDYP
ncbi:MAG: type I restriction endonuclease [Desulfotomaculales bacterium]